jgi:hypothetical protein
MVGSRSAPSSRCGRNDHCEPGPPWLLGCVGSSMNWSAGSLSATTVASTAGSASSSSATSARTSPVSASRLPQEQTRSGPFHTFRHTFASLHLSEGTNLVALSRALGHHSPAFTLSRYTHLLPGEVAAAP